MGGCPSRWKVFSSSPTLQMRFPFFNAEMISMHVQLWGSATPLITKCMETPGGGLDTFPITTDMHVSCGLCCRAWGATSFASLVSARFTILASFVGQAYDESRFWLAFSNRAPSTRLSLTLLLYEGVLSGLSVGSPEHGAFFN